MTITSAPPAPVAYSAVEPGTPFRLVVGGPILYKTDLGGSAWVDGQLCHLGSGAVVHDNPGPNAPCLVTPGAFVEQL